MGSGHTFSLALDTKKEESLCLCFPQKSQFSVIHYPCRSVWKIGIDVIHTTKHVQYGTMENKNLDKMSRSR